MEEKWYRKRVPTLLGIVVSLAVLLAILWVFLGPKTGNTSPLPSPSSGASDTFTGNGNSVVPPGIVTLSTTAVGTSFSGMADTVQINTRSTTCAKEWTTVAPLTTGHGWGVLANGGGWYYAFGAKIMWCTNSAGTRVTSLPEFRCFDLAGFFNFDWCHSGAKNHSSLGGYTVDFWPNYEYYLPHSGVYRHPHIDITVAANGHFWGTAYSAFRTICSYPAGNDCHT